MPPFPPPTVRSRRRIARALVAIAVSSLLPACRSSDPGQACAFARVDTRVWTRAERPAATLLIPPGYRADSAAVPPAPSAGDDFATWASGEGGEAGPASRIIYNAAASVAYADPPGGDTVPGLRDLRRCVLRVDGKPARVSTSWMEDAESPTGRSYQTVARWTAVKPGREMGIFIVTPTADEQKKLLGVLSSVHFR